MSSNSGDLVTSILDEAGFQMLPGTKAYAGCLSTLAPLMAQTDQLACARFSRFISLFSLGSLVFCLCFCSGWEFLFVLSRHLDAFF